MAATGAGMTSGYVSSNVRASRCCTESPSVALSLVVRVAESAREKDGAGRIFSNENSVALRKRISLQVCYRIDHKIK